MDKVYIHDKVFVPFMPYGQISQLIDGVANKLNKDFCTPGHTYTEAGQNDVPVLLCVLHGSIMFTGELLQRLNFPVELASMKLSSYVGTTSTGVIRETMPLTTDIKGRTVIVCEDIVDTGLTIHQLKAHLRGLGAASIRVATMLFKPRKLEYDDAKPDYICREITDEFVIGYGLDFDGFVRNLDAIYKVKK